MPSLSSRKAATGRQTCLPCAGDHGVVFIGHDLDPRGEHVGARDLPVRRMWSRTGFAVDHGQTQGVAEVIVRLTTSQQVGYDFLSFLGRLTSCVRAFMPDTAEIGKQPLWAMPCNADDPISVRHETGDLIQAGVD